MLLLLLPLPATDISDTAVDVGGEVPKTAVEESVAEALHRALPAAVAAVGLLLLLLLVLQEVVGGSRVAVCAAAGGLLLLGEVLGGALGTGPSASLSSCMLGKRL